MTSLSRFEPRRRWRLVLVAFGALVLVPISLRHASAQVDPGSAHAQPAAAQEQGAGDPPPLPAAVEPEPTEPQPVEPAGPQTKLAPLLLVYPDADEGSKLEFALEKELGREVTLMTFEVPGSGPTLKVLKAAGVLNVTFSSPGSDPLERVVRDPEDPSERIELLTLLCGSLARDGFASAESPAPVPPKDGATKAEVGQEAEPRLPYSYYHFSLFHPVSTNAEIPDVRTRLSLSLLHGRVGKIEGVALGGYQSAQYGVDGLQLAYLANVSRGLVDGAQLAFAANVAAELHGLSLGGVNVVYGKMMGAALGFVNASGASEGVQLGFGVNVAQDLDGLGLAGFGNGARDVEGAQLALAGNVARDVVGLQLGGINVARDVHGVQLGIVNVASDIRGVPIGVVSVSKTGGVHPSAWFSTLVAANLGVRFSTRNTFSVVYGSWDVNGERAGVGYAVGGSIPILPGRIFAEMDLSETYLVDTSTVEMDRGRSLTELRGSLRFQVLSHLGFFVGGGYVGKVEPASQNYPGITQGSWYYEGLPNFTAGIIL